MYLETPLKSHTNIVNFDFIIRFQVDRYKYEFSQGCGSIFRGIRSLIQSLTVFEVSPGAAFGFFGQILLFDLGS